MKKLTDKIKYEITPDGDAVLFLRRKDTQKWEAVASCHISVLRALRCGMSIHTAQENGLLKQP